jgi:glycosyltransferase involved in cell wall biosynthesis
MNSSHISVVILTYQEEVNIRFALESVRWSDNVLVVDSFSTDQTETICREYPNVTFVQNRFVNLATQRQFALDSGLLKGDWVLALDADEYVPEELRDELIELFRQPASQPVVAYDVAMRIVMWGKWLKHSSEYPVYWRRLINRTHCRYVQRGHADTVDADGPVGRLKHDLVHHDRKGLTDWLAKHNRYTTEEAKYALAELQYVSLRNLFSRDRLERRRSLKRIFRFMPLNSVVRFLYLYLFRFGFLDGVAGMNFCRLRAHQHFIIRLKIEELRLSQEDHHGHS